MNIYEQKSNIKKILGVIALLIGAITLYYTDSLVNKLEKREEKLIDLYAKGMEFIINSEDTDNIGFLFSEIVEANNSIPVILTDENFNPIPNRHRNIKIPKKYNDEQIDKLLRKELEIMREQHEPIEVAYQDVFKNYVFFKNSWLLTQLKYYPIVQLGIISSFIVIAYFAFSYSRKSEQNNVWVGMAKETAHQLGTPLSSLMGWLDYFKNSDKFKDEMVVVELEKDIQRLETITERFSNIGSLPTLTLHDVYEVTDLYINYFQKRVSSKVNFGIHCKTEDPTCVMNIPLYEWVLENLCKNAVDAMAGEGNIDIIVKSSNADYLEIDVCDTGAGMTSEQRRKVFDPGFTTKKRGWGLGLTLSKRIIDEYHKGKLIVKETNTEGTVFQIQLKKSVK